MKTTLNDQEIKRLNMCLITLKDRILELYQTIEESEEGRFTKDLSKTTKEAACRTIDTMRNIITGQERG